VGLILLLAYLILILDLDVRSECVRLACLFLFVDACCYLLVGWACIRIQMRFNLI
jgi:hypothetical protein